MAVHEQRPSGRVGALEPGDNARPAWCGLQDRRLQADLGQPFRHVLRGGALIAVTFAEVDRGNPDELMAHLDRFGFCLRSGPGEGASRLGTDPGWLSRCGHRHLPKRGTRYSRSIILP